jgi:pilus assembly protein FimV
LVINKRKILQSAQKHMQKGALDKALKDYTSLLEGDPKDVNIRLKVGDIHLKQGDTDEAVASYLKVAQLFMKDGFDSKAIALFKQVTRIDPKRYDVYLPLSELYQRLGLSSDAMKALQTAADAHYREGDKDQALDLLRKMATIDPSNTTNRLRVAELLRQESRESEALCEYDEVAEELDRQGDAEGRVKVLQKILELDPGRTATFVALGSALVEQKKWSQAGTNAENMIEALPGEPEGYELLAEICRNTDREGDLPEIYRRLAEVYKDRGDEDHAREIMQRFVSTTALDAGTSDDPILESDGELSMNAAIGGDGTLVMAPDQLADSGFLSNQTLRLGDPISDPEIADPEAAEDTSEMSQSSLPPLASFEGEPTSEEEAPEPEGDPEQLFAEASVYFRYGKHERAVASLRAILSQDPDHRAALEKLGEALVATGDTENAVTAFSRAAEAAQSEGDDAAFESLRERIEALDPTAAETRVPLPAQEESEPGQETAPEEDPVFQELGTKVDSGVEAGAADETLDSDESIEFEIEDDFELDDIPDAAEAGAAESELGEEASAEADDIECDLGAGEPCFEDGEDLGVEEEDDLPESAVPDAAPAEPSLDETIARAAPSPSGVSSTTPQQMVEELEEADFYFQQGLHDEAAEVYNRILRVAPNHPHAMLRLGEIEAALGETGQALPEQDSTLDLDPAVGVEETPPETPDAEFGDAGPEPTESTTEQGDGEESGFDMDLADPSSLPGFEGVADLDVDAPQEPAAVAEPASGAAPALQAEETLRIVPDETTAPTDSDAEETAAAGDFDLAAELSGAFDGEDTGPFSGGMGGTTEEEGFELVFSAFKQGVQEAFGEGDFEARYDLGIAYKEMGLLEDAIGEFQIALGEPTRKLASLHAMGLCALELERVSDAISHLEQALAVPEVPADQQSALHFDLGRAYQEQGNLARAREAYEMVAAVDPDFGDVGERIAELTRMEESGSPDEARGEPEEETFESFDGLIEGVEPQPESESYESFEDLMSEDDDDEDEAFDGIEAPMAEGEPVGAELDAEPAPEPEPVVAELDAEPAPELEPAPEPSAPKKPARRKKISFV